jgi:predicted Zn-dependent peptidase
MPDAGLVANVGPAAIRGLHERAVVPSGSTLVLVGELSPARTLDQVAQALDGWRSRRAAVDLQTPPPIVGGPLIAFDRAGSVQSQVRLSAAGRSRHDDGYPALQLANLIYGGYFSSRLVENIREDKGYTYSAGSNSEFWPSNRPGSPAAITVSFDTTSPSTAAAVLEARYELGRLALTPPAAAEVESARNYALGTLATSLATQAGYASTLSALAGVGLDGEWLRQHPVRLAAVSVDEVASAAAEVLAPARFTGVVVGDLDTISTGLSALGDVTLP